MHEGKETNIKRAMGVVEELDNMCIGKATVSILNCVCSNGCRRLCIDRKPDSLTEEPTQQKKKFEFERRFYTGKGPLHSALHRLPATSPTKERLRKKCETA